VKEGQDMKTGTRPAEKQKQAAECSALVIRVNTMLSPRPDLPSYDVNIPLDKSKQETDNHMDEGRA